MRMGARVRRIALGVAVMCAAGAFVTAAVLVRNAGGGEGVAARPGADLAVVMLGHPDRLVTVDLDRMTVVSDVGLRSLPTDLVLDRDGRAVTAQAGGIGDEADDVVGVCDVRAGGRVRYLKLAYPNPGFLVTVGARVFAMHGIAYKDGLAVSVVDTRAMRTVRSGLLPDGPGCTMAVADGSIWTLASDPASLEATDSELCGPKVIITRVDPDTLVRRAIGGVRAVANQVVATAPHRLALLSGRLGLGPAAVTDIDATTGEAGHATVLPDLRHGAMMGCLVGERLAVSEWDGGDPSDEGEWIAWLDSGTLARQGSIRISGGPCAMAPWGDRLVVIERTTGRLLVVDLRTARVTGSVRVADRAPVIADVQVLPGRRDSHVR